MKLRKTMRYSLGLRQVDNPIQRSIVVVVSVKNDIPTATPANASAPAPRRHHERCAYIRCCYLADALNCYGYKADCKLYQKSNGKELTEAEFNTEMDTLIDQVRASAQKLDR